MAVANGARERAPSDMVSRGSSDRHHPPVHAEMLVSRKDLEGLDDKLSRQLRLFKAHGEQAVEVMVKPLEGKLAQIENKQPMLEWHMTDLDGTVKALSQQVQVQRRHSDTLEAALQRLRKLLDEARAGQADLKEVVAGLRQEQGDLHGFVTQQASTPRDVAPAVSALPPVDAVTREELVAVIESIRAEILEVANSCASKPNRQHVVTLQELTSETNLLRQDLRREMRQLMDTGDVNKELEDLRQEVGNIKVRQTLSPTSPPWSPRNEVEILIENAMATLRKELKLGGTAAHHASGEAEGSAEVHNEVVRLEAQVHNEVARLEASIAQMVHKLGHDEVRLEATIAQLTHKAGHEDVTKLEASIAALAHKVGKNEVATLETSIAEMAHKVDSLLNRPMAHEATDSAATVDWAREVAAAGASEDVLSDVLRKEQSQRCKVFTEEGEPDTIFAQEGEHPKLKERETTAGVVHPDNSHSPAVLVEMQNLKGQVAKLESDVQSAHSTLAELQGHREVGGRLQVAETESRHMAEALCKIEGRIQVTETECRQVKSNTGSAVSSMAALSKASAEEIEQLREDIDNEFTALREEFGQAGPRPDSHDGGDHSHAAQTEVQELRGQVGNLLESVSACEQRVAASEQREAAIEHGAVASMLSLQKALGEHAKESKQLREEIGSEFRELREEFGQAGPRHDSHAGGDHSHVLQTEVRELRGKVGNLLESMSAYEQRLAVSEQREALSEHGAVSSMSSLQKALDEHTEERDVLQTRLGSTETALASLQREMLKMQVGDNDIALLQTQLGSAETALTSLRSEMHGLKMQVGDNDIALLQTQLGGAETALTSLRSEMHGLKMQGDDNDIALLQTQLGGAETALTLLRSEIHGLEMQGGDNNTALLALRGDMHDLKTFFFEALQSLRSEMHGLRMQVGDNDMALLQTQLGGAETSLTSLRSEMHGLETQGGENNTALLALRGDMHDLKTQVGSSDTTLMALRGDVHELKAQVGSSETALSLLQGEVQSRTEYISEVSDDVANLRTLLVCKCGSVYLPDSTFCRMCGTARPGRGEHHDGHPPARRLSEASSARTAVEVLSPDHETVSHTEVHTIHTPPKNSEHLDRVRQMSGSGRHLLTGLSHCSPTVNLSVLSWAQSASEVAAEMGGSSSSSPHIVLEEVTSAHVDTPALASDALPRGSSVASGDLGLDHEMPRESSLHKVTREMDVDHLISSAEHKAEGALSAIASLLHREQMPSPQRHGTEASAGETSAAEASSENGSRRPSSSSSAPPSRRLAAAGLVPTEPFGAEDSDEQARQMTFGADDTPIPTMLTSPSHSSAPWTLASPPIGSPPRPFDPFYDASGLYPSLPEPVTILPAERRRDRVSTSAALFARVDTNKDGVIDREELRSALAGGLLTRSQASALSAAQAREASPEQQIERHESFTSLPSDDEDAVERSTLMGC